MFPPRKQWRMNYKQIASDFIDARQHQEAIDSRKFQGKLKKSNPIQVDNPNRKGYLAPEIALDLVKAQTSAEARAKTNAQTSAKVLAHEKAQLEMLQEQVRQGQLKLLDYTMRMSTLSTQEVKEARKLQLGLKRLIQDEAAARFRFEENSKGRPLI